MQNKKLAILIVLIIVMIIVWMPKGRRRAQVSPKPARVSLEKVKPAIAPGQRRSEFVDWGRNPFVWSKVGLSTTSDFTLSGIIWDEQASYAIIDGMIVHAGDQIAGKTVKQIEPSKVILTDGTTDYILDLE